MKNLKTWLVTIAALLCSTVVSAYDFSVGGIYYTILSSSSRTVGVSHDGNNSYSGTVVIPGTVTYGEVEYAVTSINSNAFLDCSSLSSVTIGDNVTAIGSYAFLDCSSLSSVTIPDNVTSISNGAFNGCTALKDLVFEDGNSSLSLGYNQNGGNKGLFYDCSLETLYLGRDLSYSSDYYYGYSPFAYTSLSGVTIGDNVTSIGRYAFSGCSSLTSITIPYNVTTIGEAAFANGVQKVVLEPTTPPALSSSNLIDEYGCFVVPQSALAAYQQADYWKGFSNITYAAAYKRTVSLTAQGNTSDLEQVLGMDVLPYVADLTITGTINSYDFMVMLNKMHLLRHVDLSEAHIVGNPYQHYTGYCTYDNQLPAYAFYEKKLLTVKLPQDITSIGQYAFYKCNLAHVDVPVGVTSIGNDAFYYCYRLQSIVFPQGLTSIGNYAFQGCSSLTSAMLPITLQTIGYDAFSSCSQLTELRIPSSVRSIENNAFYGCGNLKKVYVYTVEPTSIEQNTFAKNDNNNFVGVLYAPKVSFRNYWYDTQWSQFEDIVAFDEPFDNFYLEGDKELNESTGTINGTEDKKPDAEMGNNSGLVTDDDIN